MLKIVFALLLSIHGLIHLMGFAQSIGYGGAIRLTKIISTSAGLLWGATGLLFIAASTLLLLRKETWPFVLVAAIIVSQILVFNYWPDAKFGTIINIIALLVAIAALAGYFFESQFKKDVRSHFAQSLHSSNSLITQADITHLPLPVQEYLQYTGAMDKPRIQNVLIEFEGEMREKGKDWFPFHSIQYNFMEDPARLFFMKAKMKGLDIYGYHDYQKEQATMRIKLLGIFNVVNATGPAMNKAETVTLFNDMCLFAPASLIDKRIQWEPIDSFSAKATYTNGVNSISATLLFNAQHQLINFFSDDRYDVGKMKQFRFSTPVKDYIAINGRMVPTYGEAIWHYPEGLFVYGKFRLKSIAYNAKEMK